MRFFIHTILQLDLLFRVREAEGVVPPLNTYPHPPTTTNLSTTTPTQGVLNDSHALFIV